MSYSKIAKRYAKALFDFSKEKNSLEDVKNDMDYIHELCAQSEEFVAVLNSPIIKVQKKKDIVAAVVGEYVSDSTMDMLRIIADSRRESIIPTLTDEFIKMYNESIGLMKVDLYSAVELSQDLQDKISTRIATQTEKKIELTQHIQEDLIGGFVLKMDDMLYDASLKSSLSKLKNVLSERV
ncbi:MAG: ATP synthase F1 subunit delta [Bacteroidetes bacterium 4572_112]|nr:MAG: ATP synthase F1 subunit delta [Bacteroidetes bacterium 4572_112]